jgi:hypothetical protein
MNGIHKSGPIPDPAPQPRNALTLCRANRGQSGLTPPIYNFLLVLLHLPPSTIGSLGCALRAWEWRRHAIEASNFRSM